MLKTKFDPHKIWLTRGEFAVEQLRKGYNFPVYSKDLEEVVRKSGLSHKDLKISEEEIESLRREYWADEASLHWSKLQVETWFWRLSNHLADLEDAMRKGSLGPRDIGISEEELDAKRLYIKAAESDAWRH